MGTKMGSARRCWTAMVATFLVVATLLVATGEPPALAAAQPAAPEICQPSPGQGLSVSFTSPADRSTILLAQTPEIDFRGLVTGPAAAQVTEVDVFTDGTYLIRAELSGPGPAAAREWSLPTTAPGGEHRVLVCVRTATGAVAGAEIVIVVVEPDPDATVYSSNAYQLTAQQTARLTAISDTSLTFSGEIPVEVGQTIVAQESAGLPKGLLRRVEAISRGATTTTITTGAADFTELFWQLNISATIPLTGPTAAPPDAPSAVTAQPGDGTATVSWLPPVDNGGSPVTAYRVVATDVATGDVLVSDVSGDPVPTSATIENLVAGRTYTLSVLAVSAAGESLPAIAGAPITVTSTPSLSGSPPVAEVGSAYSFAFTRSGFPTPAVSIGSGTVPPGLLLSADGVLSGTPTAAGRYTFVVTADNGRPPAAGADVVLEVVDTGPPDPTGHAIQVSTRSDRSQPLALDGFRGASGTDIFVFVPGEPGIQRAAFTLDGQPVNVERTEPFDFATTGPQRLARPLATDSLSTGRHTITAELTYNNRTRVLLAATFEIIASDTAEEIPIFISQRPDRGDPLPLDGAVLPQPSAYIFADFQDAATVNFQVDGTRIRTERAPFDLGGGNEATARPFKLTSLAPGPHTVTARATFADGSSQRVSATFVIEWTTTAPVAASGPAAAPSTARTAPDVVPPDVGAAVTAAAADPILAGAPEIALAPSISLIAGAPSVSLGGVPVNQTGDWFEIVGEAALEAKPFVRFRAVVEYERRAGTDWGWLEIPSLLAERFVVTGDGALSVEFTAEVRGRVTLDPIFSYGGLAAGLRGAFAGKLPADAARDLSVDAGIKVLTSISAGGSARCSLPETPFSFKEGWELQDGDLRPIESTPPEKPPAADLDCSSSGTASVEVAAGPALDVSFPAFLSTEIEALAGIRYKTTFPCPADETFTAFVRVAGSLSLRIWRVDFENANSGEATVDLLTRPRPDCRTPVITTPSLPPSVVGVPYRFQLAVTEGEEPYIWVVEGLPSGFEVSESGLITGTATSAQVRDYPVSIAVADDNGAADVVDSTLVVRDATPGRGFTGGSAGDPRFDTYDRLRYEFQAAGEFVLTRSLDDEFEVQTRTQFIEPFAVLGGLPGRASGMTATAVNTGDSTVEFSDGKVFIDGRELSGPFASTLPNGATVGRNSVRLPDGTLVLVSSARFQNVRISLAPQRGARVEGLLGNANRTKDDELTADGNSAVVTAPLETVQGFTELYEDFGPSWVVQDADRLLSGPRELYRAPQSPADVSAIPDERVALATAQCRGLGWGEDNGLAGCIFDLAYTGILEFADPSGQLPAGDPVTEAGNVTGLADFAGRLPTADAVGAVTPGDGLARATPTTVTTSGAGNARYLFEVTPEDVSAQHVIVAQLADVAGATNSRFRVVEPDGTTLVDGAVRNSAIVTPPVIRPGIYSVAFDLAAGGPTASLRLSIPRSSGGPIASGADLDSATPTAVTVQEPGQRAVFTLTITPEDVADQRSIFAELTGSTFTSGTALTVKSPSGATLATTGVAGPLVTPPVIAPGVYSVVVDPDGLGTGAASLRVAVPDRPGLGVVPGTRIAEAIPAAISVDSGQSLRYEFPVTADDLATPRAVAARITTTGPARGTFRIVSPMGLVLASSGGPNNTIVTGLVSQPGTYAVIIDATSDWSGSLRVIIPTDAAIPLDPGPSVEVTPDATVTLTEPGQVARGIVTISDAEVIAEKAINIRLSDVATTLGTGGRITVLSPTGELVAGTTLANPSLSTFTSLVTGPLPGAGRYTILVDPFGSTTGSATLEVAVVGAVLLSTTPGHTLEEAAPLPVTTTDRDQRVRITLAVGPADVEARSVLALERATDWVVTLRDSDGGVVPLPAPGAVAVTPPVTKTGVYTVELAQLISTRFISGSLRVALVPQLVTTLDVGQVLSTAPTRQVSLANVGRSARVEFDVTDADLTAGRSLAFAMTPAPGGQLNQSNVSATVFDSAGAPIAGCSYRSGTCTGIRYPLARSGTYWISVDPVGVATGEVSLAVAAIDPVRAAAAVGTSTATAPGNRVEISEPGLIYEYRFDVSDDDLTRRRRLLVTYDRDDGFLDRDQVELIEPDGTVRLARSTGGQFSLRQSGAHTVRVRPSNADLYGATLQVVVFEDIDGGPVNAGRTLDSAPVTVVTLTEPSQIARSDVQITSDDVAARRLLSARLSDPSGAPLSGSLAFLNSNGSQLRSGTFNGTSGASYTITMPTVLPAGTYTVRVLGPQRPLNLQVALLDPGLAP